MSKLVRTQPGLQSVPCVRLRDKSSKLPADEACSEMCFLSVGAAAPQDRHVDALIRHVLPVYFWERHAPCALQGLTGLSCAEVCPIQILEDPALIVMSRPMLYSCGCSARKDQMNCLPSCQPRRKRTCPCRFILPNSHQVLKTGTRKTPSSERARQLSFLAVAHPGTSKTFGEVLRDRLSSLAIIPAFGAIKLDALA